ncbi:Transcription termination factor, mitochondrial/chloroplastic [Dillenia turbinata]|uniref:Transcription termination factor, mitochondrial/chloroplastic n=1 Tax=Dillenia turbinata TaxID=194707 RepID=A0AAN8WDH1_9MAGN
MFRQLNFSSQLFLHKNSLNPKPLPFLFRRFKSSIPTTNSNSYTVSYLTNQCGLSPESAISASKRVQFETSSRADSVLALLKNHGFSDTQITKIVRSFPPILISDSQKTLLPKLEFFHSIGVSRPDLTSMLSRNPKPLVSSLKNRIIPNYEILKGFLQSDYKVIRTFKDIPRIFLLDLSKNLLPNGEHFRKLGGRGKSMFEENMKVYERWGWSKGEILMAFRKYPNCMLLSEKKIHMGMDFYVNKMGIHSRSIAASSKILAYSLEKRIKPRCSVIRVLTQNGLLRENFSLASVIGASEKVFLDKFVIKYAETLPQLLGVYQGKINPFEP